MHKLKTEAWGGENEPVTIAAAKQKRAVEQNSENARLQLREDWEVRDGFGDVHCDPTALTR